MGREVVCHSILAREHVERFFQRCLRVHVHAPACLSTAVGPETARVAHQPRLPPRRGKPPHSPISGARLGQMVLVRWRHGPDEGVPSVSSKKLVVVGLEAGRHVCGRRSSWRRARRGERSRRGQRSEAFARACEKVSGFGEGRLLSRVLEGICALGLGERESDSERERWAIYRRP